MLPSLLVIRMAVLSIVQGCMQYSLGAASLQPSAQLAAGAPAQMHCRGALLQLSRVVVLPRLPALKPFVVAIRASM